MTELTLAGKGSVDTPEVVTLDEAQALLDSYGTGGRAIVIPKQTDVQVFFARAPGTFYYDDPSLSGSTGGPEPTLTYYTVINGGVLGNRTIFANTHGNNFYIGEIFGDVFRGWNTFTQPDWVNQQIALAISNHEKSRNHPYATDTAPGFIQLAKKAEATGRTDDLRAMTPLKTQSLLDIYGIGEISVAPPTGTDLAVFFKTQLFGAFKFSASAQYTNAPPSAAWFDVLCLSHEKLNSKTLISVTSTGEMYTASLNAGSFSGWGKKIELKDLPIASLTVAGIVQLEDSVSSTSVTKAATPNSVKSANDNANTRVPSTRQVNGKALSSDIWLSAGDVGTYSSAQIDSLINSRVPVNRAVNGKQLYQDIWLTAADVGALPASYTPPKDYLQTDGSGNWLWVSVAGHVRMGGKWFRPAGSNYYRINFPLYHFPNACFGVNLTQLGRNGTSDHNISLEAWDKTGFNLIVESGENGVVWEAYGF